MVDTTQMFNDLGQQLQAYGNARYEEGQASMQPIIAGLNDKVANLEAELFEAQSPSLLVGARVNDISWQQAVTELGDLKVTRLFYGTLPATYSRQGIPPGVLLIVSYKTQTTNVSSYFQSIPAGEQVQVCYHHESEGDYANGSDFVLEFVTQQALAHAANPNIPFVFIGGGFQYRAGKKGYDGSFIPPAADRYYLDSYQRGMTGSVIQPAQQAPDIQRYMQLLKDSGKPFNGFTEYGRGVVPKGSTLTDALVQQRLAVFAADEPYLRSLPDFRVWSYWHTTDLASSDQWRLTDTASQNAWKNIVSHTNA